MADSYALNASSLDTPCPSSQTPPPPSRFKDIPADFHMLSKGTVPLRLRALLADHWSVSLTEWVGLELPL